MAKKVRLQKADRNFDKRFLHIKVDKKEFANAVKIVKLLVGRPTSMPILKAINIMASDDCITITATDLDNWLTIEIPAEIINKGVLVVKLFDIEKLLKVAKNKDVEFVETDDNRLKVGNISVGLENKDDYPERPLIKTTRHISVDTFDLQRALTDTMFAASNDSTKIHLCSVRCEYHDQKMKIIALDGHRVAKRTINARSQKRDVAFSLPTDAVKLFLAACKIADKTKLTTEISYMKPEQENDFGKAKIELPGIIIQTRSDNQFPDWQHVIHGGICKQATFKFVDLQKAMSEICSICNEEFGMVILLWSDSGCSLSYNNVSDNLKAEIQLNCQHDAGISDIGFNPRYMFDLLKHAPVNETITFEFGEELDPIIVRHDEDNLDVILPMRL